METIEKTYEIDVPVRVAYNQWTQFEDFPRFMDAIKEVKQLDNVHLHWRAQIGGKEKEWNAQITEQVPDTVIAWRSLSGTPNAGRVRFARLAENRTQMTVTLEYEPEGFLENLGDLFGFMSRKVDDAIEDFKALVEERGRDTGGWRGEVHGGRTASERPAGASSGLVGSGSGSSSTTSPSKDSTTVGGTKRNR